MYVIQSRHGSRVIDRDGEVMTFTTRPDALAHIAAIKPEMPSKDLPLSIHSTGPRKGSLTEAPFAV